MLALPGLGYPPGPPSPAAPPPPLALLFQFLLACQRCRLCLKTFRTSVFTALCLTADRAEAHRLMTPFLAGLLALPNPGLDAHPHIDEIRERHAEGGDDALASMPAEWWLELGAIGTLDDIVGHVHGLHAAGASDVAFFPGPTVELAREDLDAVARVRASID